jgi:hypothetical protein
MQPAKPTYRFDVTKPLPAALEPLKARRQWICWDYVWNEKKQKWDKPPLSAHTGRMAKGGATNPANWGTFEQAAGAAMMRRLAGVGYVISRDDNITGIDLDHCVTDSGSFSPLAAEVLGFAETYAEVSPSGEGVRLFALGKYEGAVIKKDAIGVEVYTWGRYLTVTGNQVEGSAGEICKAPRTLAALAAAAGAQERPARGNGHAAPSGGDFFVNVNSSALTWLDRWVPLLHPRAKKQATGAWRVSSADLGRSLEEDLSYHPDGIVDHGEERGLSAVDAVLKYGTADDATEAAQWLCRQMGVEPASLGWGKGAKRKGKVPKDPAPEPPEIEAPPYAGPTLNIAQVVRVFRRWLYMGRDGAMPLLAMLGTIAANRLPGKPVWLALVAPPSTSKTELLDAVAHLPDIHEASSLTPAGLLSATPKKSREVDAKGGILNQIGAYGIITFKDFTTVLAMRRETMAEILAALREVYDGKWKRSTGSDGGREYKWKGKVGVIIGVTEAIDTHHGVMVQMGERFVMLRLADSAQAQLYRALEHAGNFDGTMKTELADAVSGLFAGLGKLKDPRALNAAEKKRLNDTAWLAVRLRAGVERDHYGREILNVFRVEGPSRLGLTLERLLAGLCAIGVSRRRAFQIIEKVALDSVPPTRLKAWRVLRDRLETYPNVRAAQWLTTTEVSLAVDLPTTTVRRALEELQVHGLVLRESEGEGKAHKWCLAEPKKTGPGNLAQNVRGYSGESLLEGSDFHR